MSKVSNVNPGNYKTAGRGRQGEGLLQEEQKRAYADQREMARRESSEEQAGIPAWEATPPNLETEAVEAPVKKPARKKRTKKPASRRAARRVATKAPRRGVARKGKGQRAKGKGRAKVRGRR